MGSQADGGRHDACIAGLLVSQGFYDFHMCIVCFCHFGGSTEAIVTRLAARHIILVPRPRPEERLAKPL